MGAHHQFLKDLALLATSRTASHDEESKSKLTTWTLPKGPFSFRRLRLATAVAPRMALQRLRTQPGTEAGREQVADARNIRPARLVQIHGDLNRSNQEKNIGPCDDWTFVHPFDSFHFCSHAPGDGYPTLSHRGHGTRGQPRLDEFQGIRLMH
jgi:hypothetical protein